MTALNQPFIGTPPVATNAITPAAIITTLAEHLSALRATYYDATGHTFDYRGLNQHCNKVLAFSGELAQLQPNVFDKLSPEARTAFWLNVYNLLAIHAVIAHGVTGSVLDKHGFFTTSQYQIGDYRLSLDDIEHGILRGNAKKYLGLSHPFSADDPRLALVISEPDPRIHFALYAACRSSPPWQVYMPDQLDTQLDHASRDTLRRDLRAGAGGISLSLPKVFQWYANDFGSSLDIVRFVHETLADMPSLRLGRESPERVEIAYLDYDWSLNQTE